MIAQALDWVSVVDKGGVVAVLVLVIFTGAKGYWVFRREFEAVVRDRDEWKEMARTGTFLAKDAVKVAERRRGSSS